LPAGREDAARPGPHGRHGQIAARRVAQPFAGADALMKSAHACATRARRARASRAICDARAAIDIPAQIIQLHEFAVSGPRTWHSCSPAFRKRQAHVRRGEGAVPAVRSQRRPVPPVAGERSTAAGRSTIPAADRPAASLPQRCRRAVLVRASPRPPWRESAPSLPSCRPEASRRPRP